MKTKLAYAKPRKIELNRKIVDDEPQFLVIKELFTDKMPKKIALRAMEEI